MMRSRTRSSSATCTAELSSAVRRRRAGRHLQLGDVLELLAGLARGEHDPDRLRQQAPRDERQRQRRGVVQPLRVIDDPQQRTLLRRLRQQAQHRQPDEEPVRRRAGAQPEDDLERLALGGRKPAEAIEQRSAQLMEAREGQLHLGLHAHRPHDGQVRRRLDQVVQQRRLADSGLASSEPATGSRRRGRPRPTRRARRTRRPVHADPFGSGWWAESGATTRGCRCERETSRTAPYVIWAHASEPVNVLPISTQAQLSAVHPAPSRTAKRGVRWPSLRYLGGVMRARRRVLRRRQARSDARYTASVAAVRPPAGLGIAALYLWGIRWWPGVLLGELVVNGQLLLDDSTFLIGSPLGQQAGNMAEVVVGALLLRLVHRPERGDGPRRAGGRHDRPAGHRDSDQRDRGHDLDGRRRGRRRIGRGGVLAHLVAGRHLRSIDRPAADARVGARPQGAQCVASAHGRAPRCSWPSPGSASSRSPPRNRSGTRSSRR